MIPELGLCALILALALALFSAILPSWGLFKKQYVFAQALAKPLAYGQCFFVLLSFLTLTVCFVQNDFSVNYIAQNSYSQLPLIYKICAVWGAHEGSLLLWALILTLWTSAFAFWSRPVPQTFKVLILSILAALQSGFLILLLCTSNPFERLLPFPAKEGADLNPLLQDPGFIIHPPFLYLGYVGFAIPFAFAIAALIKGTYPQQMDCRWVRPWALLAWAFLTVGIILGSWWAYYELGWGGWWFWDPVENASFMPWLVGAALVHALSVSSSQKAFSAWSLLLALSAFILSLVGTFLVRSGVLSSVHAFANDPLRGAFILSFLGSVILSSFVLYFRRQPQPSQTRLALLSKPALILLGNMIFFVAMLTVLLGTLYPLFIDVLFQTKISVGPPYFNSVFLPIMIPALVLMAIAPYVHWREDSIHQLKAKLKPVFIIFCLLSLAWISFFYRWFTPLAMTGILLGGWIALGTLFKLIITLRKPPFWRLGLSKGSMFIAHLGISFVVLGMTLTSALETEKEFKIAVGQTAHLDPYDITLESLEDIEGPNFQAKQGHFKLTRAEKTIADLYPQKRFFIPRGLPMTETAIDAGFFRDLYIALGEPIEEGTWSVRFYIKPFVRWIWLGGLLIALGAVLGAGNAFSIINKEQNNP